ncbi:MAG: hypothetical protein GY945_00755 [Rhodobacteraceae bacterium]|nr:hypothetical protein [Paracoccaceae bacterium]
MATVDHFAAITWQYGADWCDFDYQEQDMAQHSSAATQVLVLIIITKRVLVRVLSRGAGVVRLNATLADCSCDCGG